MSEFVERIDSVLKKLNLKRNAFCDDLGLTHSALTDWNKRNTIPGGDVVLRIADYLGVNYRWLISGKSDEVDDEEQSLLVSWRRLLADQKETIKLLIRGFEDKNKNE